MDTTALQRLDAWPYRHRLAEVMRSPVVSCAPEESVRQAIDRLAADRLSALIVVDRQGIACGIVTERDLLAAIARTGSAAFERPVADIMSSPVESLPQETLLYRALGRLDRRGFRHLLVVNGEGRPVGLVTSRSLLRQRTQSALALGDEIDAAGDVEALRRAHDRLPDLARGLLAEGIAATDICAAISAITRDITARAAELALAQMPGPAPCPWCLLVLGSAGRGESLLAPDQDNALIYDGAAETCDAWFAAFGQALNTALDRVGIPLCKGEVMVRNPAFRRSLEGWQQTIAGWVATPDPQALLSVDIFFDFVAIAGTRALAQQLRRSASELAAGSPLLLRLFAGQIQSAGSPFDLLGRLRSSEGGLDLKKFGLFPAVAMARTLGLACASEAVASDQRLSAASAAGLLKPDDADRLRSARAVVVDLLLRAQLADLAAGRSPGTRIETRGLRRNDRDRLKAALQDLQGAGMLVEDALQARRIA